MDANFRELCVPFLTVIVPVHYWREEERTNGQFNVHSYILHLRSIHTFASSIAHFILVVYHEFIRSVISGTGYVRNFN